MQAKNRPIWSPCFTVGEAHAYCSALQSTGGGSHQGCQIFLATTYQNGENIPITLNYTQKPLNMPNGSKIYQHLPSQDPPKLTQIGIFGLKTNHLAAQVVIALSRLLSVFSRHEFCTSANFFSKCWLHLCRGKKVSVVSQKVLDFILIMYLLEPLPLYTLIQTIM
jgi:hypothetical protein